MLRKLPVFLSFATLALLAAFSIGCGSSSKSPIMGCTGGPFNVVGPWQITVSPSGAGSTPGFGAIDSSGLALFFDNTAPNGTGQTLQLPTISGACSFSGSINIYTEPGGPMSGQVATASMQGNVNSSSSISGTYSGNTSGSISATSFSPLTGAASALQGSFFGEVEGSINLQGILQQFAFTPTGTGANMNYTNSGVTNCSISGTFTQVNTANVFDVSMTFTGQGCPITGTFNGIGFESNTDYFGFNGNAAGTYLYADILASSNTFVMEFYP